jgi:TonB family protein
MTIDLKFHMRILPFTRRVVSSAFLAILLTAFAAVTNAQNPPLSLADLLIGLRSKKVSLEDRNLILSKAVMERGITFVNSTEIEKELTATGADGVLVSAVRSKSSKPVPAATPKPVATPVPTPTLDSTFFQKRADASLEKGEVDSALADYNKAVELKADDANLYVSRGKALYTKKAFDQSVKDYDKAIQLSPKTAVAFLNRGASYEKMGDAQKALDDFRKAVELDSANETAKAEVTRIESQFAKEAAAKEAEAKAAAAKLVQVVPEYLNLGNLSAANAIRMVTPTYSPMARQSRIVGLVNVEVEIDIEGEVVSARSTSGPAMLRQSAEDAAKRSKFKPVLFNEKPIKGKGVIVYNFSL